MIKKREAKKIGVIKDAIVEGLEEDQLNNYLKQFKEVEKNVVRENILKDAKRIDGRAIDEVRNIEIETNFCLRFMALHYLLEEKLKQ